MRRAVFLDRDGTINEDVGHITDPDLFVLIPGAIEAIRRLRDAGYFLVLATNQAGVGRGLMTEPQLLRVLDAFEALLEEHGAALDAIRYCPHHPEEGKGVYKRECECRKPGPGQLLSAAEEYDIDLSASFMVGDHYSDVEAGLAAGCRSVMLLTGHGTHEYDGLDEAQKGRVDHVAEDLAGGVDWILRNGIERKTEATTENAENAEKEG
jgi:D-glycero-D-manno-heptose 1,7-bisphosphate phosphatase